MNENSELLWVTVPGGMDRKTGEAVLRVIIMPRLAGSSLAEDGMENWPPEPLTTVTLEIDWRKSSDAEFRLPLKIEQPHIQAQRGLWQEFFPSITSVTPAQRRRKDTIPSVEVAETSRDAEAVNATFAAVAQTSVTEESATNFHTAVRAELANKWSGEGRGRGRANGRSRTRTATKPDFHDTLMFLREHPAVMRALGLIIELRRNDIPLDTEGFVRVRWTNPPLTLPKIVSPITHFGPGFLPFSTANISSGMVTLTDDRLSPDAAMGTPSWEVHTVDVDGGVAKLRNAAQALVNSNVNPGESSASGQVAEEKPVTLPALRTAGLLLVRRGRSQDFDTRRMIAETNADHDSMNDAVLSAENLVLGYRLDISRDSGDWLSLHKREAKDKGEAIYKVNKIPISSSPIEEGHLKAHAAIDHGDGVLRADEVVARWSGWSLAVPQPMFDGRNGNTAPARRADVPFDLEMSFEVPEGKGRLPLLRFPHTYRIRARVADIAGGGLDLDDPAANRCFIELKGAYQRYEPISPPDIVLPAGVGADTLGPAESIEHIVIRSDGGSVAEFLTQNPLYNSNPLRVLQPPRISLALAEQHGKLDRPPNASKEAWEQKTFEWMLRAMSPDESGHDKRLADPAAGGICIFPRHKPGEVTAQRVSKPWEETETEPWPEYEPRQLKLIEPSESAPGILSPVEWIGDTLQVKLAKAEQVTLDVSTEMRPGFLDNFAIKPPLTPTSEAQMSLPPESEAAVMAGRHPLVTPARTVALVHAVRRPLKVPSGTLTVKRELGQTFAIFVPEPPHLNIDPSSTAKLEVTADWTERNDDKTREIVNAKVQTLTINRGDEKLQDLLRHEFGDTRHRMVKYTLTAVSRFRQFFHEDEDAELFLARTPQPVVINVLNSARPTPPIVISTRPSFLWEEDLLASLPPILVRRRRAGLRVELEGSWFQTGEGEQLAVIVSRDLNPDPAQQPFLSQVGRDPIWNPTPSQPPPNRWLVAPMFKEMSGDAEEMFLEEAVTHLFTIGFDVEDTLNIEQVPEILRQLFEEQGILLSPLATVQVIRTGNEWKIVDADQTFLIFSENQTLDVYAGDYVVAVPYEPWFHDGHWYADIAVPDVAAASYCPFVQLAVARYQPDSLEHLELSQVVKTEMVQLFPDRSLTVTRSDANVLVTLEGLGPTDPQPNRVDVILERGLFGPGMAANTVDFSALEAPTDQTPAWVQVAGQVQQGTLGGVIQIQVPPEPGPFRIRVREVEVIGSDIAPAAPQTGTTGELNERVVFTDVVSLMDL